MTKKTVRDIDLAGKRVLVRVDYNVPIKGGQVGDTLRIKASFDTIKYLLEKGCAIVLMSHLGRPDGKPDPKLSLRPVAAKAAELLGHPIDFLPDCIKDEVRTEVDSLQAGDIVLLENLRFHPEEEANDPDFAKQLAELGEVYVDDAFAAIHRAHASTVGVTKYLPAVAGLLVEREVDTITGALENPKRPLLAVIGGAKISDKIDFLSNLISRVDALLIGGAMANTFLAAQGHPIGKSLSEPDQTGTAQKILEQASKKGVKVHLPTDVVVADKVEADSESRTVKPDEVTKGDYIVDLGPDSIAAALDEKPETVIWNGPLGVTEIPEFAKSSLDLARRVIDCGAMTVIGGGDTAAFVDAAGLHDKFAWVSTGGGASLELMAGKKLPGVEALLDK